MSQDVSRGLAIVQQQITELNALLQQTLHDLNTVAGTERVAKWKATTVTLLTEAVGQQEGQRFARVQPGPSFTNDLVEEFSDVVDSYRLHLTALAKQLAQRPHLGS